MAKRIAIFGGTFDPIHIGHLRIAEEARERLGLETVLFVPNNVSPFKTDTRVTPGERRLEMVGQAVADNPAFAVSRVEIDRPGPSYAVETVRTLREVYADADLFFLTGADAIRDLPEWREPEALLAAARFVAMTRPGADGEAIRDVLPVPWRERITFIEMRGLDISATDLRARVRTGRSIRYLVPRAVEAYIQRHGLYAEGNTEETTI